MKSVSLNIAHLADLQVRFGSRHGEFKTVFQRTLDDLREQKPDRIVVAGDLNHHKINMSPNSFELLSWFLIELSKIAPTDIILGNHDLNLQQLEQGDSISPLFKIANMIQDEEHKVAYFVTEQNKNEIDYTKKAVYYYIDSGFYKVLPNLVYGIYSLKDNKIIKMDKKNKEPGVKYVALYHGTISGAKDNNGREMKGDNPKVGMFEWADCVLLGDIHEYQTFDRDTDLVIDEKDLKKYEAEGWEVIEHID